MENNLIVFKGTNPFKRENFKNKSLFFLGCG